MAKATRKAGGRAAAKPARRVPRKAASRTLDAEERDITLNDVMLALQGLKEVLDHFGPSPEPMTPPAHLLKLGDILAALSREVETFGPDRIVPEARGGGFGSSCGLCRPTP